MGETSLWAGRSRGPCWRCWPCEANAPVSVDRLIDGLWGERPPATAPKLVQVMVSQLRKQLVDTEAEIVTRGRGYELRVDPDARRRAALRASSATGRGRPAGVRGARVVARAAARRSRERAVRRARDPAPRGALARGARGRDRHRVGRGTPGEALREVDELVRRHPLHEPLHAQRMLALYRCGRQAEALEAFRDARQALLDEVGLEPGPELRHLNDAILRQDADLDGPAPRTQLARPRAAVARAARGRRRRGRRGRRAGRRADRVARTGSTGSPRTRRA